MSRIHNDDVLVCGGGMAGVFAAIGAAEAGASVLLVEPHNVLGGQGTAGGVAGFCGDTARVNRFFNELIAPLEANALIAPYDPSADRRPYDLEHFAFALQETVGKRKIDVLLHARAVQAERVGRRITEVGVATIDGLLNCRAAMVIDATGECAVAAAAGLETMHEPAMRQLPMGLYFTLWDTHQPVRPYLPPGCPAWSGDDELPMTTLHQFASGKVEVKMKLVGFDAADAASFADAELAARRQMMGLIYHLQTRGYRGRVLDRHVLASVSRQLGVREGRRVVGEHVLTVEQVKCGAQFDDAVAVGTYHLDYHWPDRVQRAGTGITTPVPPYHIPLRSLVAKGCDNLLVPGRGASGDQMAMSSFRVMATCAQTGLAAGLAAAQCLRDNRPTGQADVAAIQQSLARAGQSLKLADYGEYLSQASEKEKGSRAICRNGPKGASHK